MSTTQYGAVDVDEASQAVHALGETTYAQGDNRWQI